MLNLLHASPLLGDTKSFCPFLEGLNSWDHLGKLGHFRLVCVYVRVWCVSARPHYKPRDLQYKHIVQEGVLLWTETS